MSVYNTKFRCENVDGITLSVIKSALQKFIRRNELELGTRLLTLTRGFDNLDCKDSKKIISNIVNRLVVSSCEEVNINDVNSVIMIYNLYKNFTETRV